MDEVQQPGEHQDGGWRVPRRTLPPPRGASQALRDSIAATPQPDLSAWNVVPQSEDEWLAVIDEMDAGKAETTWDLADQWSVSVEHDTIAGVDVHWVTPSEIDLRHEDHLFVYVHGGAFVLSGGVAGAAEAVLIADRARMRAVSIDYRMPPTSPAPAGRDDVVVVWQELLSERRARAMALGGSSAGANICLATVQRLIELGSEVPGALYLGTPGADMSKTSDSWYVNEGIDRILPTYDGFVEAASRLYADGRDLTDPIVSPLYGSFAGFPPSLLISGTRDLLLGNTVRTHIKLRQAGALADLLVYEGISHNGYTLEFDNPEGVHAYAELSAFLLEHLESV
jgi:monoterpene epsilon-lactone hydrolase